MSTLDMNTRSCNAFRRLSLKTLRNLWKLYFFPPLISAVLFLISCQKEPLSPERREELRLELVEMGKERWDNFGLDFYPDTSTVLVEIILNPGDLDDGTMEDIARVVREARGKHVPEYRFIGRIKQFQWTEQSTCCPELVLLKEFR